MPAHYALSDAAIVLVSLFAGQALWRNMKALPAFAMVCFGVAACIGVVRFGGGLQDALAALHSGASQYLGLAGAFAILAHYLFPPKGRNGIAIMLALAVACAASIVRPGPSRPAWLVPVACAVMLANTLFIRRAAWLDEAVSWHAYHLIIALALAALAKGLMTTEQRVS